MKADRRNLLLGLAGAGLSGCSGEPEGAGTSQRIRWLARREGGLHIYSNTSRMRPALDAFIRQFPDISIRVEDINSLQIANRVQALADQRLPGPDFVWSTAMDLQVKLINDGYAQTYRSPHRPAMPSGSVWRDQGFGLTSEPIVFAYNRRLLPPEAAPQSHAELLERLNTHPDVFDRRVTVYDAERSGVALMQLSADVQIYPDAWRLMEALGARRPRLDTSGRRMMQQVAEGSMLFVYNMNAFYGLSWLAHAPDVAIVAPSDYHLSVSRVAFIPRNAAHPNAARLFLDFLLSRQGQRIIASLGMHPVRDDLGGSLPQANPVERPIRVGPALLANLDQARRADLLGRWRAAMRHATRAPDDPLAP